MTRPVRGFSPAEAARLWAALEAEFGPIIPARLNGRGSPCSAQPGPDPHKQPDGYGCLPTSSPSGHHPAVPAYGRTERSADGHPMQWAGTADEAPAGRVLCPIPPGPTPQTTPGIRGRCREGVEAAGAAGRQPGVEPGSSVAAPARRNT